MCFMSRRSLNTAVECVTSQSSRIWYNDWFLGYLEISVRVKILKESSGKIERNAEERSPAAEQTSESENWQPLPCC